MRLLSAYPDTLVGRGSFDGGGEEGLTGRAAICYDHGCDAEVFYLGLALDERYVESWVEGCLKRIGEDDPDEEQLFRDLWDDETQRDVLKGKPQGRLRGQGGEACGSLRYMPLGEWAIGEAVTFTGWHHAGCVRPIVKSKSTRR